jgi:predicted metalloprotease with PDZ domain
MDGDIPYEHYTFLVALDKNIGGGLEHLNSTALQASFDMFKNKNRYNGFLGLVAHEYFHLWNVKRIRPIELGPFDYDNETYTRMLWLSEGFTDYLDTMFPNWTGFTTESALITSWESSINSILSSAAYKYESVSDASFNAWIRYYRAGELQIGSSTTISYYTYGSLIGLLLDMRIIKETNGEKSIRDLFIALNKRYKMNPKKGITFSEFKAIANQVAGRSVEDVINYVNETKEIDFNAVFKDFGLTLSKRTIDEKPTFNLYTSNGIIRVMYLNSYLYQSGLSIEDELIAIDKYRVGDDYNSVLENFFKIGQEVTLTINRKGRIQEIKIKLQDDRPVTYSLTKDSQITDTQKKLFDKWIKPRNN